MCTDSSAEAEDETQSSDVNSTVEEDQYLTSLGLLYLKLQAKLLLPASTIQTLMEEFQNIHRLGRSHLFNKLHCQVANFGLSESDISNLVQELERQDLFHACN